MTEIKKAAEIISKSRKMFAFTGAGISVESGVPPFRGEGGVWEKYDPNILNLDYYLGHQAKCWKGIYEVFYNFTENALPNLAHNLLAELEKRGLLAGVVTQNIDGLHENAGTRNVIRYHGSLNEFICPYCEAEHSLESLKPLNPDNGPVCGCGKLLKPAIVFFGEQIPEDAIRGSYSLMENSDVVLVIGTTGEVYPAAAVPIQAARNGASIIEINPNPSAFTNSISDVYIPLKAAEGMNALVNELNKL